MPKSIADEALDLISALRNQRESASSTNLATLSVSHDSNEATAKKSQNQQYRAHDETNPIIDTVEAAKHLRLCGFGELDPVILCAYGDTNKFTPSRPAGRKNYDWDAVTKQAKNGVRQWVEVEAKLTNDTKNLGFISCPGGTRVKCKPGRDDIQEITEGQVLFFEVDKGLTREEQIAAPAKAGLPKPTFQLDTGHRSVWSVYCLDTTYPVDDVVHGRKALSHAIEAAHPGVLTDHALWSPHQPARLAGGIHPKTGVRSTLINVTEQRYKLDEILCRCPDLEQPSKSTRTGSVWRAPNPSDQIIEGTYPSPHDLSVAVPLTLALAKANVERINNGQQEGQGTGRPLRAYYLSRCLQAGFEQLQELGYDIDGTPEELFDTFCRNSKNCGLDSLEDCRSRHYAEACDIGTGDKSKPVLLQDITHWAEKNNHWRWELSWSKRRNETKCSARSQSTPLSRRNPLQKPKQSVSYRHKVLTRYLARFAIKVRNTLRRNVILRDAVRRLDLKHAVKDPEIAMLVMQAQDDLAGNTYRALNHQQRAAMEMPTVDWIIPQLLPACDATLVVGSPKVGKTRLAIAIVRAILQQLDCMGFTPCEQVPSVILISDDQSAGDTAEMLKVAGILDHPKLFWSQRFRLSEDQLDQLLNDIRQHQGAIVVIDSLRSITRSTGISENDQQMGNLVYDLKQVTTDIGGTLLLVHHSNKKGLTGQEASSGHSSITGAANGAVSIHYLEDENNRPKKDCPYRRVVREARSGEGFDIVVRIKSDGSFQHISGYEDWLRKQDEEEAKGKKRSALQQPPKPVVTMLATMADLFDQKHEPLAILDLMKSAKICRASVPTKAECNKTEINDYTTCTQWMGKLVGEGFLAAHRDESKTPGAQRRRLYELTQDGRNYVEGLEGGF